MNGLDSIANQFYTAGTKYSAAIQPYALKLFFALLLIEILVTWIQYTVEGLPALPGRSAAPVTDSG